MKTKKKFFFTSMLHAGGLDCISFEVRYGSQVNVHVTCTSLIHNGFKSIKTTAFAVNQLINQSKFRY